MARLLLIDDDQFVLRSLRQLLVPEGHFCVEALSGAEAQRALASDPFDLVVLDVGLPDTDGFTLCRQIRAQHHMPIILLSARSATEDRVCGLKVGADDYVPKPFQAQELLERVRAHLRRAREYGTPLERDNRIDLGELIFDADARVLRRGGEPISLTQREFEVLDLLARHPGKALASEWIFENIWGYDAGLGIKALTVTIQRLRVKIESDPRQPRILLTVRGFGYKLVPGGEPAGEPEAAAAAQAPDVAAVQRLEGINAILEVVRRTTGLGLAVVARVTEDAWTACAVRDEAGFGLRPGDQLEVAATY